MAFDLQQGNAFQKHKFRACLENNRSYFFAYLNASFSSNEKHTSFSLLYIAAIPVS